MSEEYKPLLAITMGDAAGSGPEIITKALAEPEVRAVCRPIVIGDAATMQAALDITGVPGEIRVIEKLPAALFQDGIIEVIDRKEGMHRQSHLPGHQSGCHVPVVSAGN